MDGATLAAMHRKGFVVQVMQALGMDKACLGAVGKLHRERLKIDVAVIVAESSSANSDRPRDEEKQEEAARPEPEAQALPAVFVSNTFCTQVEKE